LTDLPNGWHRHENGDIWDGPSAKARPVMYQIGQRKWMICGDRSTEELVALAEYAKRQAMAERLRLVSSDGPEAA
jgi:hypothetical protein